MLKQNNKQGFTLIELLVVIAIIGLLSTLSILALNTARARARDTKRITDVRAIQTALEMYYNDKNDYPATTSLMAHGGVVSTTNGVYLKVIPTPPTPVDSTTGAPCSAAQPDYTYTYVTTPGTGGTYTLQYCLGAPVNGIPAGLNTATAAGISQ